MRAGRRGKPGCASISTCEYEQGRRNHRGGKGGWSVALLLSPRDYCGFPNRFTLQGQAGRLFKPLAYTKTFAMLFSSFLAVTLTPVLMTLFVRGRYGRREEPCEPPSALGLRTGGKPRSALQMVCPYRRLSRARRISVSFTKLGSEFMPPLYEGTLFYMPVTSPGRPYR